MNLSKKRTRQDIRKKTVRLYIFPGAPNFFYQQGNHNSCFISSLVSALHYMGDEYASKYIINRMQKSLLEINNKGRMHFYRDILMVHQIEKKRKNTKLLYWGMTFIHVIWYILEWFHLYNCVFVTRHVSPDWSLYRSLW